MDECDSIFMSIRRISRAIDLHSKRLARTSGLSVPQLLVMRAVRRHGGVPIRLIAKEVWLSQATVTTIIDRLESHGYLLRERSREDRRVVHVALTEVGNQKLDEVPGLMQADFVDEFARLDGWEQQMLMSALDRVARMLTGDEPIALSDAEIESGEGERPPKAAA